MLDKSMYRDMWVYIEQEAGQTLPVSLELCCEARKLCDAAGEKLVAVVVGSLPEEKRGVEKLKTEYMTCYFAPDILKFRLLPFAQYFCRTLCA